MSEKPCKFCQKPITWQKRGDTNVPMNPDGTEHRCRSSPGKEPGVIVRELNLSPEAEGKLRMIFRDEFKKALEEMFTK